nr:hypothetical protein CFP56_79224 [Quercus suber]
MARVEWSRAPACLGGDSSPEVCDESSTRLECIVSALPAGGCRETDHRMYTICLLAWPTNAKQQVRTRKADDLPEKHMYVDDVDLMNHESLAGDAFGTALHGVGRSDFSRSRPTLFGNRSACECNHGLVVGRAGKCRAGRRFGDDKPYHLSGTASSSDLNGAYGMMASAESGKTLAAFEQGPPGPWAAVHNEQQNRSLAEQLSRK